MRSGADKMSIDDATPQDWNIAKGELSSEQVKAAERFNRASIRAGRGNPLDGQVGGDHYKKLGEYQPWKVLQKWLTPEELKGAMKKEVITYLAREADKGGMQDIEKAMHTLQIYLELVGESK